MVWTVAQLRLNDFLKEHRENRSRVDPPKFDEVADWFKQELENDTTIKLRSKEYRLLCLLKIQTTVTMARMWPKPARVQVAFCTLSRLLARTSKNRPPPPGLFLCAFLRRFIAHNAHET
jgi:mRNA-degrading endonuclease RelE of RelBE toxin-antitoxin system